MKRTFRLVIILISIVIVGVGIGLWRNHYLKIKNAEPVKIYKGTPEHQGTIPKDKTVKQVKADKSTPEQPDTSPKDTTVQSDDTDIALETRETAQPTDDSTTPEDTDNIGELTVHPVFTDIVVQNLPPKAAAALKLYDEVQLATPKLTEKLKVLYKAKPIDFDAIGVEAEKLKELNDQRKESLEILSEYSKQASDKFDALLAQEREADRIMEDLDEGEDVSVEEMKERIEAARESR